MTGLSIMSYSGVLKYLGIFSHRFHGDKLDFISNGLGVLVRAGLNAFKYQDFENVFKYNKDSLIRLCDIFVHIDSCQEVLL